VIISDMLNRINGRTREWHNERW